MRDRDIRATLRAELEARHRDDPDTLILDELGLLQGAARVDMAVVNGSLAAWEIKSERDTLRRLDAQAAAYSRVFDYVTIIAAPSHVAKIEDVVPSWWGVCTAESAGRSHVALEGKREPARNPSLDAHALVELLWRDEALALLEGAGLAVGLRSKPRRALWTALVDHLPLPTLAAEVREALKARRGWRADPPQL
jgi:hypothetical protein